MPVFYYWDKLNSAGLDGKDPMLSRATMFNFAYELTTKRTRSFSSVFSNTFMESSLTPKLEVENSILGFHPTFTEEEEKVPTTTTVNLQRLLSISRV